MDPDLDYNCIQCVLSLAGHKRNHFGGGGGGDVCVCDTGWHPQHMSGEITGAAKREQ